MNRCSVLFSLLLFLFFTTPSFVTGQGRTPLPPFIHNSGIVINPKDPSVVYASFWMYGVYKSTDYGKNWQPINHGFKNASVYNLVMSSHDPNVLLAGTYAGGIYKTKDGGKNWFEINTGLTRSTIWDLSRDSEDPQVFYALTSIGLFITKDAGERWSQLPGGIPGSPPDQQMTLFAVNSQPPGLFLQNGGELFRWNARGWSPPVLTDITFIRSKPFAYDSPKGVFYAGTHRGLLKSTDGGKTWDLLFSGIRFPNWVVLDPTRPGTLYIGTDGDGVFKSTDGAKTFGPINEGLKGITSHKIFGLAIDPKNGQRLYVAAHSIGLFRTEDGGEHWMPPESFPLPDFAEIAAQEKAAVLESASTSHSLPPPPADLLIHCNRCHGWTHPILDNRTDVIWRAAPTPRDWTATVGRMGRLAGLDDTQKATILKYLSDHFGP